MYENIGCKNSMGSKSIPSSCVRAEERSSQTYPKGYETKPLRPPRMCERQSRNLGGRSGQNRRPPIPASRIGRSYSESSCDVSCCSLIPAPPSIDHQSRAEIPMLPEEDGFSLTDTETAPQQHRMPEMVCGCCHRYRHHERNCRLQLHPNNHGINTKQQQQQQRHKLQCTTVWIPHSNSTSQLENPCFENLTSKSSSYQEISHTAPLKRKKSRRRRIAPLLLGLSLTLSLVALSVSVIMYSRTRGSFCVSREEFAQLFGGSLPDEQDKQCYSTLTEFLVATRQIVKQEVGFQMGSDKSLKRKILEAVNLSQLSLNKPAARATLARNQGHNKDHDIIWERETIETSGNVELSEDGKNFLITTEGLYYVYCKLYYTTSTSNNNNKSPHNLPEVKLFRSTKMGYKRLAETKGDNPFVFAITRLYPNDTISVVTTDKTFIDTKVKGSYFGMFLI